MATPVRTDATRDDLRRVVANAVRDVLERHDPGMGRKVAGTVAEIAGAVTAAVIDLPLSQQKRLSGSGGALADLVAAWGRGDGADDRSASAAPALVTPHDRMAKGALADAGGSGHRLPDDGADLPIEAWAGAVAGSTKVVRDLGIARSTLHDWQQRGLLVALLKGARKHVFPLAQFVDGRPVAGIGAVLALAGHPRRAWWWLVTPCPLLGERQPIDLLREDRVKDVVDAARSVFDRR